LGNIVSLIRVKDFDEENIRESVYDAIDNIDFNFPTGVTSVFIKPNLCYYWDYSTGETTDPRVISALIDYLRAKSDNDLDIKIVESDATSMKVKHAFKMLGYEELAKLKSVELVNLCEEEVVERNTKVNGHEVKLLLPSMLLKDGLLINVPKLKTGPFASGKAIHITCALKNLFGCIAIPRKIIYHSNLNEVIVAVNKMIKTNLTVVDGIIAKGKYPCKLGLIMAGTEGVCIDYVASKIMGYDPSNVTHLSLAIKEGVGKFNGVEMVGEKIEYFSEKFPKVNNFIFKWSWELEMSLLRLYTRIVGDNIPPAIE
jgi:uncharacterized protein (DUF362 family)